MYNQGHLGISEFQVANQKIDLYVYSKFDNMKNSIAQARSLYVSEIYLKDEETRGSVLTFTKYMTREIEKAAFLVVDNI